MEPSHDGRIETGRACCGKNVRRGGPANRAGFTSKDDSLPKRLLTEPAKTGPAKGLVNGLDKMLPEYYKVRGWTPEGVPTPETRQRLGL